MSKHWIRKQRKMAAVIRQQNDQRAITRRARQLVNMTAFATMHPYVTSSDRTDPLYCQFMQLAETMPERIVSPDLSYVLARPERTGTHVTGERTGAGPNRLSKQRSEGGPTRAYMIQQRDQRKADHKRLRADAQLDIHDRIEEYLDELADLETERQAQIAEEVDQYLADMHAAFDYDKLDDYAFIAIADDADYPDDEQVYGHDWWTYEPLPHGPGEVIKGCGCRDCVPMLSAMPLWVEERVPDMVALALMDSEYIFDGTSGFHDIHDRCYDSSKSVLDRELDHWHDHLVDALIAR